MEGFHFSLFLIILSSVFAIILVSAGVKLINIRSSLQQNRERIKSIHRLAVIGKYSDGIKTSFKANFDKIDVQTKELQMLLKRHGQNHSAVKQGTHLISGIENSIKEINEMKG